MSSQPKYNTAQPGDIFYLEIPKFLPPSVTKPWLDGLKPYNEKYVVLDGEPSPWPWMDAPIEYANSVFAGIAGCGWRVCMDWCKKAEEIQPDVYRIVDEEQNMAAYDHNPAATSQNDCLAILQKELEALRFDRKLAEEKLLLHSQRNEVNLFELSQEKSKTETQNKQIEDLKGQLILADLQIDRLKKDVATNKIPKPPRSLIDIVYSRVVLEATMAQMVALDVTKGAASGALALAGLGLKPFTWSGHMIKKTYNRIWEARRWFDQDCPTQCPRFAKTFGWIIFLAYLSPIVSLSYTGALAIDASMTESANQAIAVPKAATPENDAKKRHHQEAVKLLKLQEEQFWDYQIRVVQVRAAQEAKRAEQESLNRYLEEAKQNSSHRVREALQKRQAEEARRRNLKFF